MVSTRSLHTATGELRPTPPFDFSKSLDFLEGFGPMEGQQALTERSLAKAVSVSGQTVVFEITSSGDVDAPRLEYTLFSDSPIDEPLQVAVADRVTSFLSLEDDLVQFYALAREDPKFAPVVQRLYGYHQVKFLTPFENAAWTILSQRNPMSVAAKIKGSLMERYGGSLEVGGTAYPAFPEPDRIAVVTTDELVNTVRNERRATYLSEAAAAFAGVDDEFLRTASYDEVEAWLRCIRGIGEWSASFILLRGLGRTERLPRGEARLLEAASRVYGGGLRLDDEAVRRLGERYGLWQGLWAHYLRVGS